jgi:hypothetical protein
MVQTPRHSPALPLALTLALTLSLTLSLALSSSGQGCALELAQRVGDEAHRVRCTGTDRLVHGVGQDGLEVVQLEVLVHLHSAGREAVASGREGCGEGCGAWAGERTSSGVIAPHRTRVAQVRPWLPNTGGQGSAEPGASPWSSMQETYQKRARPSTPRHPARDEVMQSSAPLPSESTPTAIATELFSSRVAQTLFRSDSCHRCVLRFSGVRDVSLYMLADDVLCHAAAAASQNSCPPAAAAAVRSEVICPLCLGMLQQTLSPTSLEEVAADVCKVRS